MCDLDGVMRSKRRRYNTSGYNPSRVTKDVSDMVESLQRDSGIDFAKFLSLMGRLLRDEVSNYDDLQEGFRVFDRNNNGHVNAEEFKRILTSEVTGADALTPEEIDEVLKDANIDPDGDFDYEVLCQKLIAK